MPRCTLLTKLLYIKVEVLQESHLLLWDEERHYNRLSHRKTRQHRIYAIDKFANFYQSDVSFFQNFVCYAKLYPQTVIFLQFEMREKKGPVLGGFK